MGCHVLFVEQYKEKPVQVISLLLYRTSPLMARRMRVPK